jgi:LytS/YehU family sensor histidine kinase
MIILSILFGIIWVIEQQIIIYILWGKKYYQAINHDLLRVIWIKSYPFIAWSSIYYGFNISNELIVQKQKVNKAKSLAQSAQLEMLRYQLNPHFLFNTLSSLRALIQKKDNETAEGVVTKISEFLKYSLLEGENNKVPLAKEIKTINHYFDIEKIRFGEQLEIEYNIDLETEKFYIPVFLIHPIIENAVKHGMKTSSAPLTISVYTKMVNNNLLIEILNTGRWIERKVKDEISGTGLQNTRKRLQLAYPNEHTFLIIKKEDSVCVRIIINENSNR